MFFFSFHFLNMCMDMIKSHMPLFKPFLLPAWMNYFNERTCRSNFYRTYHILFLSLWRVFIMCIWSRYTIQYLFIFIIHMHLVRFEMIVSVIKQKTERISRHIFFNSNGMHKDNPTIFSFSIHFHTYSHSSEWRSLGIFSHMVILFGIFTMHRERERGRGRERIDVFFFFSCAQPACHRFFAAYSKQVCTHQ